MKKILIVIAFLLTPALASADSVEIRPGDPVPVFADRVVFSYATAGTGKPAVVDACLKAQRFMKGFKRVEVSKVKIDQTKNNVTCTVTGEGRSE